MRNNESTLPGLTNQTRQYYCFYISLVLKDRVGEARFNSRVRISVYMYDTSYWWAWP